MLVRAPTRMGSVSPRSTAPYQTLDSSPRCSAPITCAPGATHAEGATSGKASPWGSRVHLSVTIELHRRPLLHLHQHGVSLPAAGAEGREAPAAAPALQPVDKGHQDARAGGPDRVPERQGAAACVHDLGVHAQDPRRVDGDGGEGLVYLNEVEVVGAPPGLLEREPPGVARHAQEVGRTLRYLGVGDDGPERL